jgi:peptide/nickel transport system substrate-binding protein
MNGAPKGYVDRIRVTWAFGWADRLSNFLNGDVDFVAVPREFISQLYQSATPPYDPPNYPKDGVRCFDSLPEPVVDALFFEFAIDPATSYTAVGPAGQFSENLIPVDFFGNASWGAHVRKAFSYAIDYNAYLQQAFLGEAQHPATAVLPGMQYFDPAVQGYTYNRTREIQEFQAVPGLWDTGFNITVPYNAGSLPRNQLQNLLKSEIEAVNPKFHVYPKGIVWRDYFNALDARQLPLFTMGWLADYADPADLVVPFYRTGGMFTLWQAYSNPAMDALIDQGIATPDGPARQAIYSQIQQVAVDDCPSTTTDQPLGRHFERDWVVGWYYNPMYPGNYYYNLWKWYYVPESLLDAPAQPQGFNLPADVNYDGKVDMKDIGAVAKAFGSNYGPPIHSRWVFKADVNRDRKVDMKDIGYVAKQFGKTSPAWTPSA